MSGAQQVILSGQKSPQVPCILHCSLTALEDTDGMQLWEGTNTHSFSCPLPVDFSVEQVTPINSVC